MGERRGIKGLELWCRRVTEGYPGVKIDNMTTSWRDGLAFCAMIHHFRPELIDFSKLNKDDIYYNNELAFTVAEKYLGIPALLEPEDMVEYAVPDRLSILTYLSQFYRVFVGSQGSPSRIVPKRPTSSTERGLVSPESTSPPTKVAIKSIGTAHRDPCAKCSLPVFIAERLNVGKLLYHRTCFRCARCNSQLTLANYYETESKNQFCCETCPDEETVKQPDVLKPVDAQPVIIRSLSDEEKSKVGFKKFSDEDDYSAEFEIALEDPNLSKASSLSSVLNPEFLSARTQFFNSQIENSESEEEIPPELPKSKPPDIIDEKSHLERSENDIPNNLIKSYTVHNTNSEYVKDLQSTQPVDVNVNSSDSVSVSNQLDAARLKLGKNNKIITKEESSANGSPSLVKSRMRLFEEDAKDSKLVRNVTRPPQKNKEPVKNSLESHIRKKDSTVKRNSPNSAIYSKNIDSKTERKELMSSKFQMSQVPDIVKDTTITEKVETEKPKKPSNLFLEKQKLGSSKPLSPESRKSEAKEKQIVVTPTQSSSEKSINSYALKPKNTTNSRTVKTETGNNFHVTLREKNTNLQSDEIAEEKKKSGVSALKNLFENSLDIQHHSSDRTLNSPKLDVGKNQTEEMTISTDIQNFSETTGTSVDETVSTTQKLEDKPLDILESAVENELNDDVVVTNNQKELIPPLQTVHITELNTKESIDEHICDVDVPSQSEDSKEFIDLNKISSDINNTMHSENEEPIEENISHSDAQDVIIISDSSDDIIVKNKPDPVIEISDSVIEISDSVIEISDSSIVEPPLKTQKISPTVIHSTVASPDDKDNYPENLNPFSDDDDDEDDGKLNSNSNVSATMKSLNPFEEEDENEETGTSSIAIETRPIPAKRIIKCDFKLTFDSPDIPEHLRKIYIQRISESNLPSNDSTNTATTASLNPFEEDDEQQEMKIPTPKKRMKIKCDLKLFESPHTDTPESLRKIYITRISENPFENDDSNEVESTTTENELPPQNEARKLKVISAPKISLNPFWSDDDEESEDILSDTEPEKMNELSGKLKNADKSPEPAPRKSNQSTVSSSTSLSSASSGTQKKKNLAPKPPGVALDKTESPHSSLTSSPTTSVQHSPRSTPKTRKNKKAPLPPTSTPFLATRNIDELPGNISPIIIVTTDDKKNSTDTLTSTKTKEWENEKNVKDEVNRNRQSQCFSPSDDSLPSDKDYIIPYPANKSTYGKWKRKKGPAPSRPMPQRRAIKSLPVVEIRRELDLIELQQQGLEKQGVRLEQIIRDRCEGPDTVQEDPVPIDVEDLILQLFEVVNEKNEICRRQAELMYLQRQQRLEEEHAEIEYQIRCLMLQPEANKTDSDKAREEELINRLVEIVERRNEIIECLEMDRIREAEEDDSISNSMNTYASKRDEAKLKSQGEEDLPKKLKKKFKKEKKAKLKNSQLDVDKDIDESETSNTLSKKDKKKKKFAIF